MVEVVRRDTSRHMFPQSGRSFGAPNRLNLAQPRRNQSRRIPPTLEHNGYPWRSSRVKLWSTTCGSPGALPWRVGAPSSSWEGEAGAGKTTLVNIFVHNRPLPAWTCDGPVIRQFGDSPSGTRVKPSRSAANWGVKGAFASSIQIHD